MASAQNEEFTFSGNMIFGLSIIALNVLIFVPLMTYFGFTFWRRSNERINEDNELFFDRRHCSTIYITIAFCIFFVGIERPLSLLIYQLDIIQFPDSMWEYSSSDSPFQFFSYALGAFGIYFIFLQRELMVFYSFKYGVAQAKLVWKRLLNPDFDATDNIFVAVHDIYGSFEQTSPFIFCLWMMTVIVLPICCLYIPISLSICFLLTPPFIAIVFIAYKISPVTDRYHLRDELFFCIKIMAVSMALHFILFLSFGLNDDISEDATVFHISMATLISSYVITLWVLRQNDSNHIERPPSVQSNHSSTGSWAIGKFNLQSVIRAVSPPPGGNRPNSVDEYDTDLPTLRDLLRDKHGFNLFMMQSSKELSVENLLFICEVYQFKKELTEQHLSVPSEFIPECEAVIKHRGDYLSQIHLIHKKYIESGSPLEINISARQRRRIISYFDAEKHGEKVDSHLMAMGFEKLSMFYDRCAVEIWKLMKDSYTRIVDTREFIMWQRKIKRRSTSSGNIRMLSSWAKAHVQSVSGSMQRS